RSLASRLEGMGQALFAPPNVKGWEGGRSWLNNATVLARHNFAQLLASGSLGRAVDRRGRDIEVKTAVPDGKGAAPDPEPDAASHPVVLVRREEVTEPGQVVDLLADLLLQGDLSKAARAKLTAFLADGKPTGKALDKRIREAVHAIMTMPEYQL